ncbi:Mediator of RNA polymerase II transcription subunit 15, partial [Brachionus plicatilis]
MNPNFCRKIVTMRLIEKVADSKFNKAFVSYFWQNENGNKEFTEIPHQNSRKSIKPYYRSSDSVKESIKEAVTKKESIHSHFNNLIEKANKGFSASEVPRNTHQYYNYSFIKKCKDLEKNNYKKTRDQYVDIIFNMKNNGLCRELYFDKEEMITIFFQDQEFYDLIRFASFESNFTVLNIDTTFDLGKFNIFGKKENRDDALISSKSEDEFTF